MGSILLDCHVFHLGRTLTQNCFGRDGLHRALESAQTYAQIVGWWLNSRNGKTYFDSVRVFHTQVAAEETAVRENQIDYYDLANNRHVEVQEDSSERYKLKPEYQAKLDRSNSYREKHGSQPFKLL